MTRRYSTRDFFRRTPNALLARYFVARGVLADFDFAAMKENRIESMKRRQRGVRDEANGWR